ncbi:hypothetical protein PsYK624_080270 [Phanerochaete sordida]|uniref:Protein kinase domain-containing protein n=1 Tax=Phanerochaete sordida TaxID=48140 RepID=A0A9P3GBT3_9APHY|nr:hypothetical protein PsYK624_080270 [Phanerochaete sordida]
MATLSLDFSPVSKRGSASIPKPLTVVGRVYFEGPHSFVATHYFPSYQSEVFRGEVKADEGNEYVQEVVCKYREKDIFGLEREANHYQHNLRELQGIVVPRFYGLYKGTRIDEYGKERTVACLILEHCQADHSVSCWERSLEIKEDIAYGMLDIHFAGLKHNNFDDDHILVSERGEVRIIDFDQATAHTCSAKDDINVWGYEQSEVKFGCFEMCDVINELELWTPVAVTLLGMGFGIFSYPTPDLLAAEYLRGMGLLKDCVEDKVKQKAKEALDKYYAKYGERFQTIGHPKDIKKKLDMWREQEREAERQRPTGESHA